LFQWFVSIFKGDDGGVAVLKYNRRGGEGLEITDPRRFCGLSQQLGQIILGFPEYLGA
jgi:hypothetical protein